MDFQQFQTMIHVPTLPTIVEASGEVAGNGNVILGLSSRLRLRDFTF